MNRCAGELRVLVLLSMAGQAIGCYCQKHHSSYSDTVGLAHDLSIIERKLGPMEKRVRDNLVPVEVTYYSFVDDACTMVDKKNLCSGILLVHACVVEDVKVIFEGLRRDTFPIAKVIPINRYGFNSDSTSWNDTGSMASNNTSAFNYRRKPTSGAPSKHAQGTALDINPLFNPFVRKSSRGTMVKPINGRYDPKQPGTLKRGNFLKLLGQRGWTWGGRWPNPVDYQHIEKIGGLCKVPPVRVR